MREISIMVDDNVYETLKPMVEQKTINLFLTEIAKRSRRLPNGQNSAQNIRSLQGTLHPVDTSDLRDEEERVI